MSVRFQHKGHSNGPAIEGIGLVCLWLAGVVFLAWPLAVTALPLWARWTAEAFWLAGTAAGAVAVHTMRKK